MESDFGLGWTIKKITFDQKNSIGIFFYKIIFKLKIKPFGIFLLNANCNTSSKQNIFAIWSIIICTKNFLMMKSIKCNWKKFLVLKWYWLKERQSSRYASTCTAHKQYTENSNWKLKLNSNSSKRYVVIVVYFLLLLCIWSDYFGLLLINNNNQFMNTLCLIIKYESTKYFIRITYKIYICHSKHIYLS